MPVVAGRYTTGIPVTCTNHYCMFGREVFRVCGFYFHQFFLGSEDAELPERIGRRYRIHHDDRITIEHPCRMTTDARRTYYFLRSLSAHMAMSGPYRAFLFASIAYFVRCSFISLFMGKPQFMQAYLYAMWDFSLCRLGRRRALTDRIAPRPSGLESGEGAIVIRHGNEPKPLLPELEGAACEDWSRDDIYDPLMRGKGRVLGRAAESVWRFRGRRLVLANHHFLAFPPFSILARSVYAYDEIGGDLRLLYDNSPAASILFTAVSVPLALILAVPATAAFFLRRGSYRRMAQELKHEDAVFCAEADRALGAGA